MPSFIGFSAGPSSGQNFVRRGSVGRNNNFSVAAGDIQAMSNRLLIVGQEAAEEALQIVEDEIVKYVHPDSDHGFKFSEGRLAATIGTWKPELIGDAETLAQTEAWAIENGVAERDINTGKSGNRETVMFGAYKAIRRYRASTYSVEVGTFTPYAGLVEDGGEMPIHPYGDINRIITAHWEAHHMFAKGLFDSQTKLQEMIQGKVKGAMQ